MSRYLTLIVVLAFVPGCGLLTSWLESLRGTNGSSELKRFESEQELAEYFSEQITEQNESFFTFRGGDTLAGPIADFDDVAAAPDGSQDSGAGGEGGNEAVDGDSFSQTTTQEEGVDEADVVKTDGTYLYVIHDSLLRIVRISPPERLELLDEVPLEGYGREIYLHDNKVVALTETYGNIYYGGGSITEPGPIDVVVFDEEVAPPQGEAGSSGSGDAVAQNEPVTSDDASDPDGSSEPTDSIEPDGVAPEPEIQFERPQAIVTVIDVSTPESPRVLSKTSFDGSQASSRMIDGNLYLVVANRQDYYFDVMPLLGQPELDASAVDVESVLPQVERVDAMGVATVEPALSWVNMYRPVDPDGFGVVSIVSLDVDNDSQFTAVGIVAEPGLIYSSLEALYLTDSEYSFSDGSFSARVTTDIYKLRYNNGQAVPVATGTVSGRVLNQYSMGEYDGHLRVATTVDAQSFGIFGRTEPSNNVFVLAENDSALDVVGSIVNIAPGEQIQSARFMGPRGYLVTFVRIDPLFTLDLADHTAPRIEGELKVPGFSTFITPMDADHILTVGQYIPEDNFWGDRGVQLSIFDVTDFADPLLEHIVILGRNGYAYSEALGNPKAFTYFAEAGLVALPISVNDYGPFLDVIGVMAVEDTSDGTDDGTGGDVEPGDTPEPIEPVDPDEPIDDVAPLEQEDFDGLVVYRVSAETGFEELGRISTRLSDVSGYWGTVFTRGRFIGDDVFAVTNQGVRGAPVDSIEPPPYELVFPAPAPN